MAYPTLQRLLDEVRKQNEDAISRLNSVRNGISAVVRNRKRFPTTPVKDPAGVAAIKAAEKGLDEANATLDRLHREKMDVARRGTEKVLGAWLKKSKK